MLDNKFRFVLLNNLFNMAAYLLIIYYIKNGFFSVNQPLLGCIHQVLKNIKFFFYVKDKRGNIEYDS